MFMRLTVLATFLSVAVAANLRDRAYYEEKFFNWLSQHKIAAASGEHFVTMLQNFANNDDIIEAHNKGNHTYTLGHNQFSHMTLDEWRAYVKLGLKKDTESKAPFTHAAPANMMALPASIDWSEKGAVTGVKDQGQCGSCWSFSTTGSLEGAYQIKYGDLVSFSEQNFVDCDTRDNGGTDMGCHGGLMDSAFDWAKKWGGVCTEAAYPYTSGTTKERGTCDTTCAKNANVAPKSYTDVQKNSDSAMMSALAQQPVSVAIEADQSAFQLYKSGVFTAACGTQLDHGVLAVGYGTLDGTDYYKVKNSWGTSWGMDGYILLERGVSQKEGQCGILSGPPSYPNL
jgi:cathepsin L|mmetsp:Transcript_95477/g.187449  ORF Transcript_95477/g.187449 Transcript_95477/m.187449 type:complete len:341 (+) Transcript_95477:52-1074(+)|eukprot:CAMPEP_0170354264 /NCGR_PEP_ID=MMETSP0117_2-20130122/7_1 /TAXON_ID=400756 /ORGANISM="Durinskia baltica, Strain CSIRO CS-38" /LENGTH=340 /DNA_ID=CAMNT_0010608205 /DNA_START=42 /DNA_END=1064 /DNA_ORIENTATION=+